MKNPRINILGSPGLLFGCVYFPPRNRIRGLTSHVPPGNKRTTAILIFDILEFIKNEPAAPRRRESSFEKVESGKIKKNPVGIYRPARTVKTGGKPSVGDLCGVGRPFAQRGE